MPAKSVKELKNVLFDVDIDTLLYVSCCDQTQLLPNFYIRTKSVYQAIKIHSSGEYIKSVKHDTHFYVRR